MSSVKCLLLTLNMFNAHSFEIGEPEGVYNALHSYYIRKKVDDRKVKDRVAL